MIIKQQSQFDQLIERIKAHNQITIDTEFFWVRTYFPILCLIQVSIDDDVFLIDTLNKDINLTALTDVFEESNIQKIMHSAANDIPIIKHFLNCKVNNIFDTQVAANFLGYQNQVSLKTLLEEALNISIEKEEQFSDWRKRPLSEQQIEYAINDVKHLYLLKNHLEEQLNNNQYVDYFYDEMKNICNDSEFTNPNDAYLKAGNIQKYSAKTQRNIILLANWREATAQQKDIPIRFLFDNKDLFTIAALNPKSLDDFKDHPLSRLKLNLKKQIIEVLNTKDDVSTLIKSKKNPIKLDEEFLERTISFFESEVDKYTINKTFIASKKNIRSLAYNLKLKNEFSNSKLLEGWRYKVVGKSLKEYILKHMV
ncbi:ribonuclease D [Francisella frigiditurris]|uniref:HRDC domain protein n=1 Tax=Francisella frigiditurris TaxID=1542390 RepID=A0A1J0KWG3_9GAMM|nr:HRDC domain-containing protein [Francisella frigiditurris]APC97950.1 HRDC domain protein [Francisella frigiditurris]